MARDISSGLVASRALEGLTGDLGVPAQRINYLPNCVESTPPGNGGRVREKLGIAADVPLVLLYTRFFEFEQERLYRLFAEIHRKVPHARFLVMGRGRNREEERLITASSELGFRDSLLMAGWIEPQDLPDYLAAGDVALYPLDDTLINRAKCPAKLTELLQAGLPVVADAIGQAKEYIDPASGTLCTSNDAADMATIAAELLLNPEQRTAKGEASRSFILAHFGWNSHVDKLEQFYQRLTTEQKRPYNTVRS
jgi:glycosyltransferase involved in cell wall biosynthesis